MFPFRLLVLFSFLNITRGTHSSRPGLIFFHVFFQTTEYTQVSQQNVQTLPQEVELAQTLSLVRWQMCPHIPWEARENLHCTNTHVGMY